MGRRGAIDSTARDTQRGCCHGHKNVAVLRERGAGRLTRGAEQCGSADVANERFEGDSSECDGVGCDPARDRDRDHGTLEGSVCIISIRTRDIGETDECGISRGRQ